MGIGLTFYVPASHEEMMRSLSTPLYPACIYEHVGGQREFIAQIFPIGGVGYEPPTVTPYLLPKLFRLATRHTPRGVEFNPRDNHPLYYVRADQVAAITTLDGDNANPLDQAMMAAIRVLAKRQPDWPLIPYVV